MVINTAPVDESMSFETKQYVCVRKIGLDWDQKNLIYIWDSMNVCKQWDHFYLWVEHLFNITFMLILCFLLSFLTASATYMQKSNFDIMAK